MRRGLLAGLVLGVLLSAAPAQAAKPKKLVDKPVSFEVKNVNRSNAGCTPDGGAITVRGHLTGSRADVRQADGATLLLHGFGYAEFFWRFDAVPGYNAAKQLARRGHVVVTVDRPGYGASATDRRTCLGSQADIAHQIVGQLKSGGYTIEGRKPVAFGAVGVAGHSAGGAIAELAAASFDNIDAVGLVSYGDQGVLPRAVVLALGQTTTCMAGAKQAPLGATADDFRAAHLNAATDPRVSEAVVAARTADPCGDVESLVGTIVANQANAQNISVPSLILGGTQDELFPTSASALQEARLKAGGSVVTRRLVARTSHGIVFNRTHDAVVDEFVFWLDSLDR